MQCFFIQQKGEGKMKTLFLVLLAVSTVAFGAVNEKVYGTWKSSQPMYSDSQVQIGMSFNLKPDSLDMMAVCTYADKSVVTAKVTVPAVVTEADITVKGSGEKTEQVNGKSCSVSVQPGTVAYSLVNDQTLVLKDPSGQEMSFVK
jgi:hypothetical protein